MDKKTKIIFAVILSFLIGILILKVGSIFNPNAKTLIDNREMVSIRSKISSNYINSDNLKLASIKGNRRILALAYVNSDSSTDEKTYNLLYDTSKKKIYTDFDIDGFQLDILNANIVEYIDNDMFIVISNDGNVFSINTSNGNMDLHHILKLELNGNEIFKSMLINKSLYIITRTNNSKFNEMVLNNNIVYKLDFKGKHYKKTKVISYKFNEDDFVFSFVVGEEGRIGVLGGGHISVPGDELNKYSLSSDKEYLALVPSKNKVYKFIDTDNIWIRYLDDDSLVKISSNELDLKINSVNFTVKQFLGTDTSTPTKLPILLTDNVSIYSSISFYETLKSNYMQPYSSFTLNNESVVANDEEVTISGGLTPTNIKGFIGTLSSSIGTLGLTTDGTVEVLNSSPISYINEKDIIFLKSGNIYANKR